MLREHVRFSFHPSHWTPERLEGFCSPCVSTAFDDGPDVMDDICAEIIDSFVIAVPIEVGGMAVTTSYWYTAGRAVDGKWFFQPISFNFKARPS